MANGIKILVAAFESSGKSTLTSDLDNALVFNFDRKEYGFRVPHVNIKNYEGMNNLIDLMSEKIENYREKFQAYPKTIVIDTVTQLYTAIQQYNGNKYKGFEEHKANNIDTLSFNEFVEDSLIPSGINVVIVAHTIWDEATGRHTIPASGAFAKAGSWLSVVNDSIFIEKKSNRLVVHTNSLKFPARTTLSDISTNVYIEDYSFQDHINSLSAIRFEAEEYSL